MGGPELLESVIERVPVGARGHFAIENDFVTKVGRHIDVVVHDFAAAFDELLDQVIVCFRLAPLINKARRESFVDIDSLLFLKRRSDRADVGSVRGDFSTTSTAAPASAAA